MNDEPHRVEAGNAGRSKLRRAVIVIAAAVFSLSLLGMAVSYFVCIVYEASPHPKGRVFAARLAGGTIGFDFGAIRDNFSTNTHRIRYMPLDNSWVSRRQRLGLVIPSGYRRTQKGTVRSVTITFVPLWIPLAISLVILSILRLTRRRPMTSGRCRGCGYILFGNTSGTCPECGAPCALACPAQLALETGGGSAGKSETSTVRRGPTTPPVG
jgi:hypothetical protein